MNIAEHLPPTSLRVERSTAPGLNQSIREQTEAELVRLEAASPAELQARLQQLEPGQTEDVGTGALANTGLFMEWAVGKQGEVMRPN